MRLRFPRRLHVLVTVAVVAAAEPAAAQRLLVNTNDAGRSVYGGLHYGGAQWSQMTAAINGAFSSVTSIATMTNLAQMLEYDALWVDQRWHATAAADEIANMMAFAATGRRVVVMGENATWGGWNSQVLTALGGMEGPLGGWTTPSLYGDVNGGAGCMNGRVMGLPTHPTLTLGVNGVSLACGGYAIGGTPLFAYNVATLWRSQQNVLTILDGNIMDDMFAAYEAPLFRIRVVSWLAEDLSPPAASIGALSFGRMSAFASDEPADFGAMEALDAPISALATPEPSTLLLLAAGVAALGASRRRRT